jgi:hypothetical protein
MQPLDVRAGADALAEALVANSKSRAATTASSDVEAEMHDVAFVDDVFLAFEPQLADFLRALLALVAT